MHLVPKTQKQKHSLELLSNPSMPYVVVTGPAGTGKTALACQAAVESLAEERYQRLIITRPAVAAEEDLGYLPGSAQKKLKPYLQSMLDSLEQHLSKDKVRRMQNEGTLEIAPLSFMRGRTLEKSFIIADEMQNATWGQMKMILTRLGKGSKLVITGDPEQSDLGPRNMNGLVQLMGRIEVEQDELQCLRIVKLDDVDVVRHEAVAEILRLCSTTDEAKAMVGAVMRKGPRLPSTLPCSNGGGDQGAHRVSYSLLMVAVVVVVAVVNTSGPTMDNEAPRHAYIHNHTHRVENDGASDYRSLALG